MTISALPLPFPSRWPRAPRGAIPAPGAARLRATARWSPVPGAAAEQELPQVRRVAFAGGASVTALPAWAGWTAPRVSAPGAAAA